ncbi:hypothetical protein U9M48_015271 [Paspalum notatum var. saurae]|uniref:Uncharacterized protein n=1 Tax=Paspalum notatum var. saurae TaxID=547442 RepID=A0AAQ3T4I8_PASNO
MRWVPLPLDSRAALLPPFPICILAHLPALAPSSVYSPRRRRRRRRRRRIGRAAASAPPCGIRRCYLWAIRGGVRCSGLDSATWGVCL